MSKARLTEGSLVKKLTFMTLPMFIGILSVVAFNLADTWFVSRLGTLQLAALSFTFPVVMFFTNIAIGFGKAASSVVSRAIGEGDPSRVKRYASDSLMLATLITGLFLFIGLNTIDPLFRFLGASDPLLPYISEYMVIWYFGMFFVIVPMVGNNAIRAAGNAKFPMLIMLAASLVNFILDPIFIFGWGPIPGMGLRGAAIASVIARAGTLVASLAVLHFKERLLTFSSPSWHALVDSWKSFLYIAVPASITNLLLPIMMAVLTRLVASFGQTAVAAVGAATRVEAIVLTIIMALSASLGPVVGQNWGAKKFDRVREALIRSNRFALYWGLGSLAVLIFAGQSLGSLFSDDPQIIQTFYLYICIAPIGYGLHGIFQLNCSFFNAINQPMKATWLNVIRIFFLSIPFLYIGSMFGILGLFLGMGLANIIGGVISLLYLRKVPELDKGYQLRQVDRKD